MAFFEWNEKLDLGVKDMNGEHQKLIDLMNHLYDLNHANASKAEVGGAVKALADWTITHFEHEEAFMESIDYPELKTHRLIHENLLAQLKEHMEAYEAGSNNQLDEKFFLFLKVWLTGHIMGIDMKYGKFANAA